MSRIRILVLIGLVVPFSLGSNSDCDGSLPVPFFNEREIDFFNDTGLAAHLLVPGEVRSPSNLVAPGSGRIAIVRAVNNGELTLRAEGANLQWKIIGYCDFAKDTLSALPGNSSVSFQRGTFVCSGSLFE